MTASTLSSRSPMAIPVMVVGQRNMTHEIITFQLARACASHISRSKQAFQNGLNAVVDGLICIATP